jgi:hypothetical protein
MTTTTIVELTILTLVVALIAAAIDRRRLARTAMVRAALPLQVPRLASAPLVFFGLAASGLVRACSEWVQARLPGAM